MKKTNQTLTKSLRDHAEEILKSRLPITILPQTEAETLKLIHELQLNQIELELKNNELTHTQGQETEFENNQKRILDLIDFDKVNKLLEGFNQSTGFVTAILDLEGNVLSKSGWRQICTEFHRINPETSKNCAVSDTTLANELVSGEKYHFYKCLNGLVDVAVPIVINGEHIANLFSGQFFFDKPDGAFFIQQARTYGFNERKYLKALEKVPIVSKEQVKVAMDFLLNMTQLISEITFQKMEQLQLIEALKKSEERSRHALDHMLEGCQIIGSDWKYIYLNHTAEIHNRRSNGQLIGKRYMDMWPGIEETEVFRIIRDTLEKGVPHHLENEFSFPDRKTGWFELSIQPVPEGVFILSIDITERKSAEKAQRVSEEKYRLISDNSDDWIYWEAPDGHLKYISPACERVTGYSSADFALHPQLIHEIVLEADQEKVGQHTHVPKLDQTQHDLEFRIVTKNGEVRWISHSCSPIFGDSGEYLGRRGTNRNITERKRREEQLYESEFRFSRLWENGPFGMMMVNQEFQYENVNPTFCKILGYSETELKQLSFKDISYPDDLVNDIPNIRKLINKEISVYKTEKRYIRKDGQVIWGALTVTANFDKEGQFLYNLAIIEDITRRKQSEDDLKKSKKLLSETESIGKVGGWEIKIDTMEMTWTDEVYAIHEVEISSNQDVEKGINFYTTESRPVIEKAVQRAIQFGEPFDLELEIITTKGNRRKVHTIGNTDLEHRRVYGFFQDITERKQAEEALRGSEEQYYMLFKSINDAILVAKLNENGSFNYINVNDIACKMYGYTPEEFLTKTPDDIISENGKKMLKDSVRNLLHNEFTAYETEHVKKDGQTFPVEISTRNSQIQNNTIFTAIVRDITERKLAVEELRERENKLSTIFNLLPVGISILDQDQKIVYENPALEKILGFTKEGLQRGDYRNRKYLRSDGTPKPVEEFASARIFSEKTAQHNVITGIVKEDGNTVWTNVSAIPVDFPDWKVVLVTADITDLKQAEEVIRELNERIATATKSAHVGIWDWDIKNNILTWDDQMYALYGLKNDNFKGAYESWVNGLHPEDREYCQNEVRLAMLGEKEYDIEFRIVMPLGKVRYCKSKGKVFRDEKGDAIRMVGVNYDITERKQAEENIRILNNELEQRVLDRTSQLEEANKELEAFSYSVSHDLRAPLRHINGYVDLLKGNFQEQLPEKGKHYLDSIYDSSIQMGTLIDDLLQFSRTGRQEMNKADVDMNLLIQDVLQSLKPESENRIINWEIAKLPVIHGDRALLRIVCFNLLSNAVKFTKEKKTANIRIRMAEEKNEYVFSVSDNGAGFDMRYAHKLFGVFQRLHSQKDFEGTGIGLANVRRIIMKHGGRTWAESKLGHGAEFYFTIPKNKEA